MIDLDNSYNVQEVIGIAITIKKRRQEDAPPERAHVNSGS